MEGSEYSRSSMKVDGETGVPFQRQVDGGRGAIGRLIRRRCWSWTWWFQW